MDARRRGLRVLLALLFPLALAVGCSGTDPARYSGILDSVNVPPSWQLVRTYLKAPSGGDLACTPFATPACPSVSRYYVVAGGSAVDVFAAGKDVVTASGFVVGQQFFPACDLVGNGPACVALAKRGADWLDIGVWRPGQDAGDVVPARDGAAIIELTAHGEPCVGCGP